MKNIPSRILLCFCLFFAASVCYGSGIPVMSVAVADQSGKVVFAGNTRADGSFSTGRLAPGNYVVLFNSSSPEVKAGQFALAIFAGKKRVTANDISGKQFVNGGVGMKIDVGNGLNITGSIANADLAGGKGDATVKIINGKKFVWVKGTVVGSNLGGRWVEAGSEANARNSTTLGKDDVRNYLQNVNDPHQEGWPGGPGK
jgi:hypothetical protein